MRFLHCILYANDKNNTGEKNEAKGREMRTLYNSFLKEIMELVGDTSSSELHSAGHFIYVTLSDPSTDELKKK